VLIAGGALAAWFAWDVRGDGAHEAVQPEAFPTATTDSADTSAATTVADVDLPGGNGNAGREDIGARPLPRPPVTAPRDDATLGTIRGNVQTEGGQELPDTWHVIVEPSPFYQGAGAGVRRTVERTGAERDFAFRDLPLAGYAVHAEAPGFNSLAVHVLLTAGSEAQLVNLVLSPAGFIDGYAFDPGGHPVEGLLVTLEAEADRSRRGVTTQMGGVYLFPDVLDGNYTITFGDPETPLVPARKIAFKAPSMRFPDVEVPLTGELLLSTFDREGRPLPAVDVRGFGSEGGKLSTITDDAGKCTVQLLPPGRYRLFASTEDGRESRTHVDVRAGRRTEVELRLNPR
jgi:hypothetical protein